jgi:hypothetical protein
MVRSSYFKGNFDVTSCIQNLELWVYSWLGYPKGMTCILRFLQWMTLNFCLFIKNILKYFEYYVNVILNPLTRYIKCLNWFQHVMVLSIYAMKSSSNKTHVHNIGFFRVHNVLHIRQKTCLFVFAFGFFHFMFPYLCSFQCHRQHG